MSTKPTNAQSAFSTAARLCTRFEETAVERDRAGGTAKAERDALREAVCWRCRSPRSSAVPAGRGDAALRVAAAKAQATQVSLDVSVRIFDVMGARSTTRRAAMDRFFRNARTHTLHDPVDYKLKQLQ